MILDSFNREELIELAKAQARVIEGQDKLMKRANKRISGLLDRWEQAHSDGLTQWYRKKCDNLIKRLEDATRQRWYE